MMNDLQVINNKEIQGMIHEIRGIQVILDKDLVFLYDTETKKINQAVKRNIERFHTEFCFQLTIDEVRDLSLRSQIVTLNKSNNYRGQHIKYLPYAFTEQGVAMLSALLKTEKAVKQSIAIMNAFVMMRRFLSSNLLEQNFYINKKLEHDERIKILEESFSSKTFSNELFFDGQIYDNHSLLLKIINGAKKSIVIIDNYISSELLDILSETNKNVTIYSKNLNNNLINKYNSQYHNVSFKIDNRFHDRFIIIDSKVLYHSGASFKHLGTKCFAISKIDNKDMLNSLLNKL